jgi:hypothetical protein
LYDLVLGVSLRYGVDPSSSKEVEEFFSELLEKYDGKPDEFANWLDGKVRENFKAVGKRPKWIQNADWVFVDGKPAVFVGQMDINIANNETAASLFHDDVTFYIFVAENSQPIVIMQQY